MAITAPKLWLDGALVDASSAGVPLMGHAAQRGSLVFDVGAFHATARGPALFRPRDHARRFLRSTRIVGLEASVTEEELVDAAVEVVATNGATEGLVRWSAFFAAAESDLIPRSSAARVAVAAQLLQDPPRSAPLSVATFEDARKAGPSALPPDAKAAAAYLGPMLARRRAIAAGADEVVLLDDEGFIAEGPIANAFCVIGGTLWTPPLGRILPGITRDTVLTLARAEGIPVREEPLARAAFVSADEAFLSGTSLPLAPIGVIDGRALPAPGPVTARLLELTLAARRGARDEWSVYIRDRQNAIASSR
ncbi:MAG: aminotransferase class IV [Labilithrix sp.]|nr:aminotransferase class IV [Labilithrix sp.]MCW5815612.1 aminotransferase class IV [Labilithrix sp.]